MTGYFFLYVRSRRVRSQGDWYSMCAQVINQPVSSRKSFDIAPATDKMEMTCSRDYKYPTTR